jgi:prepilin-type N-terminal cleavage/methylation domain-containing protein
MINPEKYTIYPSSPAKREIRDAFSLVELLITISIVGILAAIIVPTFQSHTQEAKESAAKDNLRILRNTIERYAAQHNDVAPGYSGNDPTQSVAQMSLRIQLIDGNYLSAFPVNPFNNISLFRKIQNNEDFPTEPMSIDLYGWIYKAQTKEIRLNWTGTDSEGILYFDY